MTVSRAAQTRDSITIGQKKPATSPSLSRHDVDRFCGYSSAFKPTSVNLVSCAIPPAILYRHAVAVASKGTVDHPICGTE